MFAECREEDDAASSPEHCYELIGDDNNQVNNIPCDKSRGVARGVARGIARVVSFDQYSDQTRFCVDVNN